MENEEKNISSVRDTIKEVMTEVEKHNNVKAIFGEPIHERGIALIPVASINMRGGGGGGGGKGEEKDEEHKSPKRGQGNGVGIGYARKVQPLGYIEIKNDKATFKPILDIGKLAMVAIGASVIGTCMVVRSIWKGK